MRPFGYGYLGVSLFFILSGFILTWSHTPGLTNRSFYWRRIARIYPSHLAMFAVVAAVLGLAGTGNGAFVYVSNLLLVQAWSSNPEIAFGVNGVSWSLSCELLFYLAFPLVLVVCKRARLRAVWIFTACLLAIYIALAVAASHHAIYSALSLMFYTNPAVRFSQFLVGIAAARSVISGNRASLWLVFASAGVAVVGAATAPHQPAPDAWVTPAAAVLIALLAQKDIAGATPRPLRWGWVQYAGRLSFCFYLVHLMVIKAIETVYDDKLAVAVSALSISVLAAAALHHLVEKPANRWIVSRFAA